MRIKIYYVDSDAIKNVTVNAQNNDVAVAQFESVMGLDPDTIVELELMTMPGQTI